MLARVHAVLWRFAGKGAIGTVEIGGVRIDTVKNCVHVNKQVIALSPTEFRLLHFLSMHPEQVHSRSQLLDKVWGENAYIDERTVDAHVGRLREALEDSCCQLNIETVRGVGYRCMSSVATEVS
jgi:two-component system phosphate regulon response regulator PhoB